MGKQLAITENSKHIIGKKLFITGNDLVYRKVKKAFLTVGGIHRLVYSSGIKWNKYNCNITTYHEDIYEEVTPSRETDTFTVHTLTAFYAYEFDDRKGFDGGLYNGVYNANEYINTVEKANSTDLIGMYHIYDTEVWEIISVDKVEVGGTRPLRLEFTAELVAQCEVASTEEYEEYSQGSTYYGTIEVEEGELPESGTLVEGSIEEGYCVLDVEGNYYYYKVDTTEPTIKNFTLSDESILITKDGKIFKIQ